MRKCRSGNKLSLQNPYARRACDSSDRATDYGYLDEDRGGAWFGRAEIRATIQTVRRSQFFKSMIAYRDHRIWQDVYHVPSPAATLYVKFTADAVAEFALLSLKENDNGQGDRSWDGSAAAPRRAPSHAHPQRRKHHGQMPG